MKFLKLFFLSFILILDLYAQCNDEIHIGEGTFYGGVAGSSGGNCSLPVAVGDFMHCAMNNEDYDGSNACGACLEVTGVRGSALVKVVDRCPECAKGDLDLTEQAFAMVANPIDGRVPIRWKYVPCPLVNNTTIKVNYKVGSSDFYTAIQFRDISRVVTKMEYFRNDTWVNVERRLYNFFVIQTGIASPMRLRITSDIGERLIVNDISTNTATNFDTGMQFSTPQNCSSASTPPLINKGEDSDSNAFFIVNRQTQQKIRPQSKEKGAPIIQVSASENGNFVRWQSIVTDNGFFYLRNMATGMYFSPRSNNNKAILEQVPVSFKGDLSQWTQVATDHSFFYLQNRGTGQYFRPFGNAENDNIIQCPTSFTGNYTQWTFEPINDFKNNPTPVTAQRMMVSPNPVSSSGVLNVTVPAPFPNEASLSLFSLNGKKMRFSIGEIENELFLKMYLINVSSGMYLLRVKQRNGNAQTITLIVK